jgi:hypothetical protein
MTKRLLFALSIAGLVTLPAPAQWIQCTNGSSTNCTTANVGIGTTNPTQPLDVNGTSIYRNNAYYGAGGSGDYGIISWASVAPARFILYGQAGKAMSLGSNGVTDRLLIDTNGNVGIGTNNPINPLHVLTNAQGYIGKFQTTDSANGNTGGAVVQTGAAQGSIEITVVNDSTYSGGAYGFLATGKSAPISLQYASLDHRFIVGPKEAMRISSGGYVGIGTTSPQTPLHLYTPSGSNADLLRIEGAGNAPLYGLTINGAAGPTAAIRANYTNPANTTATELKFYTNPVGGVNNNLQQRMVIDGSGYVGIGTPIPGYPLDVSGSAHIAGDIIANGSITGARVIGAVYQDVAEWVPSEEDLVPGTVVVLRADRTNEVSASREPYDTKVAGVVSAEPGILLGLEGNNKAKIATTGRVRVRVDATRHSISAGDLLVTSGTVGAAMYSEPIEIAGAKIHRPGTIIGKALEPLDHGAGEILILLTLQ